LVIILIHEGGHYAVARKLGFKVEEYFVGFGPKLWSFRRGEIEYGVKALPLGGYVKIAGMNPYDPVAPEDLPRSYASKPLSQRAMVIFAGPGSHFVVGALLFAIAVFIYGDPNTTAPVVGAIEQTIDGNPSPAATAGLRPGDVIIGAGAAQRPSLDQLRLITTDWATNHKGQPIDFIVQRGSQVIHVSMTPVLTTVAVGEKPRGLVGFLPGMQKRGVIGSLVVGVKLVFHTILDSLRQIGHIFGPQGVGRVFTLLFTSAPRQTSDAASAIGVGKEVGAVGAAGDWFTFIYILAYVTVFIGLINLVPLPPFDGGHLAVLALEKLRGKAIDMRKLIPVSAVVMGFFILFVLATAFLDIVKPLPISP
jgi:membrane-associated protease RseP (regulator of RpoE activity)